MMNSLDKQYLISIKSVIQLQYNFKSLPFFLLKLSDKYLSSQIFSSIRLMNYGEVLSLIDKYLFENFEKPELYEEMDIKIFDFENISQITLAEIKNKIGIEKLQLNFEKDHEGNDTDILKHWDNYNRFSVIIEKELLNFIIQDSEIKLSLKKEIVHANLGYYTKFKILKYVEYQQAYDCEYNRNYNNYNSREWLIDAAGTDDPDVMNDVYWNLD